MSKRTEIFQDVLNEYESDELRNFCIDMLECAPQNFWSWATRSYDFAGGLIVQTLLGCMECNRLLSDSNIEKPKKRDCIRAAVMFRYVYPEEIIFKKVEHDIKPGLRKYIATLVSSYSASIHSPEEAIVYECRTMELDYNSISSELKDKITDVALADPEHYFFRDGPYANMNFWLVYQLDKDYLYWLRESSKYTYVEEPLRTYLRTELEGKDGRASEVCED